MIVSIPVSCNRVCFADGSVFTGNSAVSGAGMYNIGSNATINHSDFESNVANVFGGGLLNQGGSATVDGSTFTSNVAHDSGGGMYNIEAASLTVTNSTFEGKSADVEGGGIVSEPEASVSIGDALFCDNDPNHIVGPFDDLGGNEFSDECPDCPADVNSDTVVDIFDLLFVLANWGPCADPDDCPADVEQDGVVDIFDLLAVLPAWGSCP